MTVVGCTQTVLWQADKWKLFRRRTQGKAGRQLRLIWCWPYLCWLYSCTDRKESTVWTQSPYCSAIGVSFKTWLFTLKSNFILNGSHKLRFSCHSRYNAQYLCTHFPVTLTYVALETSRKRIVCSRFCIWISCILYLPKHTKTFTQTAQNGICPVAQVKNASVSIFSTALQSTVCPVHSGEIWATVNHYSSGHICQMNVWECWTVCFSPLMNWGI